MNILVDWFSFTVKNMGNRSVDLKDIFQEILQIDNIEFENRPGHFGYKSSLYSNGITVFFEGQDDMGIHVQLSSEGVRYMENRDEFDWKGYFYYILYVLEANVTRLDIAIDDFDNVLDLDLMWNKVLLGEVVSKFKTAKTVTERYIAKREDCGKTIYFGDRSSRMFMRCYDKGLQKHTDYSWVRFEMEMKKERAAQFIEYFIQNEIEMGELAFSVLNTYLRFVDVEYDNQNRSRMKECEFWMKFIQNTRKIKLTIIKPENKIVKKKEWFVRSCSAVANMLYKCAKNDEDFVKDLIKDGEKRLKPKHERLIVDYWRGTDRLKPFEFKMVDNKLNKKIEKILHPFPEEKYLQLSFFDMF